MSAEATASVNEDDDTEEFSLDDCAFPTAKTRWCNSRYGSLIMTSVFQIR